MTTGTVRNPGSRALLALACAAVALGALGHAAVRALARLGERGFAIMPVCVPDSGAVAWAGLRLAVVRTSHDCPAQTLALGGEPQHVAAVVMTVALPVLLLHAFGLLAAAGALAVLGRWAARAEGLVLTRLRELFLGRRAPVVADVERRTPTAVGHLLARPRRLALVLAPARRGPPAGLCTS